MLQPLHLPILPSRWRRSGFDELSECYFEILDEFGNDDAGRRKVGGVFMGFVAKPGESRRVGWATEPSRASRVGCRHSACTERSLSGLLLS